MRTVVVGWNLAINTHLLVAEAAMLAASAAALVWFVRREAAAIGLVRSIFEHLPLTPHGRRRRTF